jgi:hypothetical protein
MTQDRHQEAASAGKRTRILKEDRQERLSQLVLCRSKLSPIAAPDAARRGNKDDVTARSLSFEDRDDVLPPRARHVPKAR